MLSSEQERAVSHVYGPMMVVAGPGSGKTRVLTERIRRLLQFTDPEKICVITFAKKAAEEMRHRFSELTDTETAERVCFGTFHSVFFRWLKEWGLLSRQAEVLDEDEIEQWMESESRRANRSPAVFMCRRDRELRKDPEMYRKYMALKQKTGKIDFEDMLSMMDYAIPFYAPYHDYTFFLVDEFQDIDARQYRILKRMVCEEGRESQANLFIVGDEDQSIYGFRGSDPSLFLHFAEDFPGCRRVDLSVNYRSVPNITEFSTRLIAHNKERFDKKIVPSDFRKNDPFCVRLHCYFDEQEEARKTAENIRFQRLLHPRETVAVLCRTSQEAGRMAVAMEETGVPFQGREEWKDRQERHAVIIRRDSALFTNFSLHPEQRQTVEALAEMFPRLFHIGYYRRIPDKISLPDGLLQQSTLSSSERGEIEQLRYAAEMIRAHLKTEDVLPHSQEAGETSMKKADPERIERNALSVLLFQTPYFSEAVKRVERREGSVLDLLCQIREMVHPSENRVQLMTMHGSKGLEFDHVFIVSCCQGLCPRKEALEADRAAGGTHYLEEERRLMYVASTRARKSLTVSYFNGLGTKVSQFVHEALDEII